MDDFIAKYSHPYKINSLEQLPANLFDLIRQQGLEVQACTDIFVIPQSSIVQQSRVHKVPHQALIFTPEGVVYVSEALSANMKSKVTWIAARDIFKIKLSLILLYGKLEIWGAGKEEPELICAEYNAVAHELLAPMLQQLLRLTWRNNPVENSVPLATAGDADLEPLSYSFSNGFKIRALQADEKMRAVVSQPEIIERHLKIFKHKICPNAALAITQQQIVLLEESQTTNGKYAWIFTFCPVYRLSSTEQVDDQEYHKIKIHLSAADSEAVEVIMDDPHARKWQEIWDKWVTPMIEKAPAQ
jgi:hypothetical protein